MDRVGSSSVEAECSFLLLLDIPHLLASVAFAFGFLYMLGISN
jgi:hypothetical protein